MINKYNARKIIALLLCITFVFAFPMTVNAASKKTVYVRTSEVYTEYSDGEAGAKYVRSFKYDKYGFLKTATYKCDDKWEKCKSTFKYGKNNKLTQRYDKYYLMGDLYCKQKCKIKVNKSGYLTSYRYYAQDGSLISAKKFTLNKKNLATKVRDYDESGSLTAYRKYTYNSDKTRDIRKGYTSSGELSYYEEYEYAKNKCTIYRYDADDELIQTIIWKLGSDGRIISETAYDETNNHERIYKVTCKYKKIKTAKYKKVKAQQKDISDLFF